MLDHAIDSFLALSQPILQLSPLTGPFLFSTGFHFSLDLFFTLKIQLQIVMLGLNLKLGCRVCVFRL